MDVLFSDIVAVISAMIAILALFVGLYAAYVSRTVSTSDFQASEQVKVDTAKLVSALRSLMVKGALYTQQDKDKRDDQKQPGYINVTPELVAVAEFTHSPTALAFYSFIAKKSKEAREANIEGESWRVFFLELGKLQLNTNPWVSADRAAKIERELSRVTEEEFREIAANLGNLPKAIKLLFDEREHDVLSFVLVDKRASPSGDNGLAEEYFKDFVQFLREKKGIEDPDLDMFWGVMSNDIKLLESATKNGAVVNITSDALVNRYKEHLDDFKRSLSQGG